MGEISFPAQVGAHGWEGGQKVIAVHDGVHEGVDEWEDGRVSAGGKLEEEPGGGRDAGVVEDMEGGCLAVLLSQYEEDGVGELDESRGEEHVAVVDLAEGFLVALVGVDWSTTDNVKAVVDQVAAGEEAPTVPGGHKQVVGAYEGQDFVRLAVAHHLGAHRADEPVVEAGEEDGGPGCSHEVIVGHPRVAMFLENAHRVVVGAVVKVAKG